MFIEPLGPDKPFGTVFISYAREDWQDVKNIIETRFDHEGIPFFRDDKDIQPGQKPLERIQSEIGRTRCGVVVLSQRSVRSQ